MAVLLMSNSVAFLELSDATYGGHPAISKARLAERLRHVLQQRRHILDDGELSAFVSCCFQNLKEGNGDRKALQQILSWGRYSQADDDRDDESGNILDIDTFNLHCSYDSAIDLDAAVQIFDRDRRRGPLERLFTPGGVHTALRTVKAAGSSQSLDDMIKREDSIFENKAAVAPAGTRRMRQLYVAPPGARSITPSLEMRKSADEIRMQRNSHAIRALQDQFQALEGKLQAHVEAASAEEQRQQAEEQLVEDRLVSLESAAKLMEQRVEDWLAALDAKIEKSSQWGQKVVSDSLDTLQQQLATLEAQFHDANAAKSCAQQPAQNFQKELKELLLPMESKLLNELQASTESIEVQMQLMEEKLLHAVHQIVALEAVVKGHCSCFSEHSEPHNVDSAETRATQTSQSRNLVGPCWRGSDVARIPSVQAHPRIAHMSRLPNARYSCTGF